MTMVNRRASPVLFGFDFQVNAAIYLMLENLKELDSIQIEGRNEDIEIFLNDDTEILAQVKAVVRASDDFTHVLENLKKGLLTLSEAAEGRNIKKLEFVTNSLNPFNDSKNPNIFTGLPTYRAYKDLPKSCRLKIDKYLKDLKKLWILKNLQFR